MQELCEGETVNISVQKFYYDWAVLILIPILFMWIVAQEGTDFRIAWYENGFWGTSPQVVETVFVALYVCA